MAGNINYSAVLADLEAKKEELESAIAAIRLIVAAGGGSGGGDFSATVDPENVPVGAFLRLTIVDAVKKLLDMTKTKLGIPQIAKALERGGLPPAKPNTIYAVLRRRESEVGDLIRFGDEWALAEWYPNNPNLRKQRTEKKTPLKKKSPSKSTASKSKGSVKKTTAPTTKAPAGPKPDAPKESPANTIKTNDAAEQILSRASGSLDLDTLTDRINTEFGKKLNSNLLKGILAQDKNKRFVSTDGAWTLATK